MAQYCWKCLSCGTTLENQVREYMVCQDCGTPMTRDYRAESVGNTFHPTVDVYSIGKQQQRKGR